MSAGQPPRAAFRMGHFLRAHAFAYLRGRTGHKAARRQTSHCDQQTDPTLTDAVSTRAILLRAIGHDLKRNRSRRICTRSSICAA